MEAIQEASGGCQGQLLNTDVQWDNHAFLDMVTDKEETVEDIIINGSLGCNDHEVLEFKILTGVRKASSRVKTSNIRSADFS